jgi:hypothetical protein
MDEEQLRMQVLLVVAVGDTEVQYLQLLASGQHASEGSRLV